MEQALNTAKRLLAGLSEIQPNISVCGLDDESAKIREMKADLNNLVCGLTPLAGAATQSSSHLAQVVESYRLDMISSFEEVQGSFPALPDLATDDEFGDFIVSAENWVFRYRDYVSAREGYKMHIKAQQIGQENGGPHAG